MTTTRIGGQSPPIPTTTNANEAGSEVSSKSVGDRQTSTDTLGVV